MKPSAEIKQAMLRMYEHYSAGDVPALLRLFSQQEGVTAIGTDPDEWWEGYDAVARVTKDFFAEMGRGIGIETGELNAFEEGTVGWAADSGSLRLPDGRAIPIRLTALFRLEGGEWKIVQQHSSIGVPNADILG